MKQIIKAGFLLMACLAFTAAAQDWYHDRDARFRGEEWRGRIFYHVRVDLDHVGSAIWASGKERRRWTGPKKNWPNCRANLSMATMTSMNWTMLLTHSRSRPMTTGWRRGIER